MEDKQEWIGREIGLDHERGGEKSKDKWDGLKMGEAREGANEGGMWRSNGEEMDQKEHGDGS